MSDLPEYYKTRSMSASALYARRAAQQIALTTAPFLPCPLSEARVLDIGCGYGYTTSELATMCRHAVGLDPSSALLKAAEGLRPRRENLRFDVGGIDSLHADSAYELVVLDNVLEHIRDQAAALRTIARCLVPGGVAFILVPNKLWPIEVHYHLPFLSWLPLPLANRYLYLSGRGKDYTDSAYAPTFWSLKRMCIEAGLQGRFVPPADVSLASGGRSALYRWGVHAVGRWSALWAISKAFLLLAIKPRP